MKSLATLGYRASARKAQLCQQEVQFLGYKIKQGQRRLTEARKRTVTQIASPSNRRQLGEFLGTAGFCRLWLPGYATLTAPLYPLTKADSPFIWKAEQQNAFNQIKQTLLSAPALALPDVSKPFTLYLEERNGIARGSSGADFGAMEASGSLFIQEIGRCGSRVAQMPSHHRCCCLANEGCRQMDSRAAGNHCRPSRHGKCGAMESVVRQPPDQWLTNARITHYQSLLLDKERIHFGTPSTLNPATLLPEPSGADVEHSCQDILAEETGLLPDLSDQPLPQADVTYFTDGSRYVDQGVRKAGAAVVSSTSTFWAEALPAGTSAQKAELLALTEALQLAAGKRANIYTDSRYAFATAHSMVQSTIVGDYLPRPGKTSNTGMRF